MIKMKSNKKKITMAIGMVLGVTVLAGATFASYNTSNGYDVAKTAVKGLMKNENYTANMTTKISLDGKEISSDTLKELYDRNGDVKINKENKVSSYDYNNEYREWVQDDTNIISSTHYDGEKRTLVEENASEYLNLFGEFDKFYTEDANPYTLLGTDPIVKNVSVKFTVDNEGRFTNLNAEASMVGNDSNGEKHEATVNITLDMSDYGTTKPERVDISTLPNVEYSNNSEVDTYYGDDE